MTVKIYANACYDYKSKVGGWGTVLVYGDHVKELNGTVENTSQYEACVKAVKEGFLALRKANLDILIISSATSVVSPLQNIHRVVRRIEQNIQSGTKDWQTIIAQYEKHNSITAEWIRTEENDLYGKRSIELANMYKQF